MKVDIKIPSVGESVTEVTIGNIIKPNGSQVRADEEIIELETAKLNQVLYAPAAGRLSLKVKQGDIAKVGDLIGSVETSDVKPQEQPAKPTIEAAIESQGPSVIAKQEWLKELEKEPTPTSAPVPVQVSYAPKEARETRQPLSAMRKVIAKRMLEASQQSAMLTTFNEADMSEVMKLREQYKELFQSRYKVKLGFMSFFVKAVTSALKAFPIVNSYLDGSDLVTRHYIDIGVAVSSERGLLVPVLKGCDELSFADIEKEIDDFMARAKTGSIKVDELMGGSFTITNGGVFGSLLSTPIINPPQCAILGMHKITKRAVVVDDQIVIRPMMYLALSYDHRVLDGKEAVSFLVHIKNMIEDPHRLELGV